MKDTLGWDRRKMPGPLATRWPRRCGAIGTLGNSRSALECLQSFYDWTKKPKGGASEPWVGARGGSLEVGEGLPQPLLHDESVAGIEAPGPGLHLPRRRLRVCPIHPT